MPVSVQSFRRIKDVNQSLVDDNLVEGDKIGAANFFWSFPGAFFLFRLFLCLSSIFPCFFV